MLPLWYICLIELSTVSSTFIQMVMCIGATLLYRATQYSTDTVAIFCLSFLPYMDTSGYSTLFYCEEGWVSISLRTQFSGAYAKKQNGCIHDNSGFSCGELTYCLTQQLCHQYRPLVTLSSHFSLELSLPVDFPDE